MEEEEKEGVNDNKKRSGFFTSVTNGVKNAIGITTSSSNIKKTIINCVYKAKKNINLLISEFTDISLKNNLINIYKINNNDLLFNYNFSDDNLSSLINSVSESNIKEKLKILIKILDLSKAIRNYYSNDDKELNITNKDVEGKGEEEEEEEEEEGGTEEGEGEEEGGRRNILRNTNGDNKDVPQPVA